MAVIEVTEAEAALLARLRAGEQLPLEQSSASSEDNPSAPSFETTKTLSGAILWAQQQNSPLLLDDQFSHDLEEVIRLHERAAPRNPWGD